MPVSKKNPDFHVRFIQELYENENLDHYNESTMRTVTFNFPARDACMLASIAKRFGKSTAAFGGELFASNVAILFAALTPEDRIKCAVEADAEIQRYEESKGVFTVIDGEPAKVTTWQRHADVYNAVDEKSPPTDEEYEGAIKAVVASKKAGGAK